MAKKVELRKMLEVSRPNKLNESVKIIDEQNIVIYSLENLEDLCKYFSRGCADTNGREKYNQFTQKYGQIIIYINKKTRGKVGCTEKGDCFRKESPILTDIDMFDRYKISKDQAAEILGVDSLSEFDITVNKYLASKSGGMSESNNYKNKKQIKETMGKKVLRYTENEFVQLLENIVKKVKKEERLEESRKESRKKRLSENLKRIRAERGTKRPTRRRK